MLMRIRMDVADANLTGFASNITGEGPFTMTATNSGDYDGVGNRLAHQVSLRNDSANSKSGITFTLTGTDANGNAQVETMAGPGTSATVESTKYFATLETVAVSATLGADTVDVGWVDDVATKIYGLNWSQNVNAKMLYQEVGTVSSFDVQFTCADWKDTKLYPNPDDVPWITPISNLAAETGSNTAINDIPAGYTGFRCLITGYSSGAEAILYCSQPAGVKR